MEEKEIAYQIASIKGLGSKSIFKLLEYTGNIKEVLSLSEIEVRNVLDVKTANAFLHGRENINPNTTQQLEKEKGIKFVPFITVDYPERLRNISEPPFSLYVKGTLPQENKPTVAIVGARECSEYGKAVASFFGRQLGTAGVQIISGMARGIDGIAQQGAVEVNGFSFAVLGCGADVCYPQENSGLYLKLQERGGIISEYPPGTKAQSKLFPARNRIISGLADLILVVEARKRSGTYITVMQALEQGKEVYAVPGRITDSLSDGCNYLLSQGAGVAVNPYSIIEELSKRFVIDFEREEKKKQNKKEERKDRMNADEDEQAAEDVILSSLEVNPVALEELYSRVTSRGEMDMSRLMLILTKLQIKGMVVGEGNYYRIINAL